MARLSKADVLYVAKLAKLDLSEREIKEFLPQLSSIVDHISQLGNVDTSKSEPTSQTTGLENVFRGDDVTESSLDQDSALSGTDNTYNGYFKVPAILEGRTDK
jgi:aspartyl-tRNA(Asn)/glutamyl-tRNA(Gln) amidotransferase subunit C